MWMDSWILNVPPFLWPTVASRPYRVRFFETQTPVVVLSSSNQAEQEVEVGRCADEGIPILRRRGGGGTVVLGPGCVVLTAGFFVRDLYANDRYFRFINQMWMDALAAMGVHGLTQRGISDIALGSRKVAGTSIFRKKNLLVYQGSLLVNADVEGIQRLLRHPSREPDYRAGRSHGEFVTTLAREGYPLTAALVADACSRWFDRVGVQHLKEFLEGEGPPVNIPAHQWI